MAERGGWRRWAAAFVAGGVVAGAAAGALGLAVVEFGLYDTTARTPHGPFMEWAAHTTYKRFTRRTAAREAPPAPAAFTPAQVQAGLQQYRRDCVACHGGPGVGRAVWTQGINPPPPYLLDISRRYSPRELYFILDRGVKMSAMPAWGETRSPAELWNYVALLEALPRIKRAAFVGAPAASAGPDAASKPLPDAGAAPSPDRSGGPRPGRLSASG